MNRAVFLIVVAVGTLLAGCSKSDLERETHENLIISGNTPPDYNGVSKIAVQNYVNRMYIDMNGREPDDVELSNATNSLIGSGYSKASRVVLVDGLLNSSEYYARFFDIASEKMLNGSDSTDIIRPLGLFTLLQYQADTSGDSVLSFLYGQMVSKLTALLNAKNDYKNGLININEFYAIMIDNNLYDDINMGSDNFVVGTFENLFNRYPTEAERTAGVNMVDGLSSSIFLKNGDSKSDFIGIVTTVDPFYEGLVVDAYLNLLLRSPNSFEMSSGTDSLVSATFTLQDLQRKILISEEYAGF
jgi:hypothetical protein